jgi:acyl carrier protein
MSATFDKVADIIAETCDIPRENIKPESHAINDLEIDSLDFLDIAFAIDKTFVQQNLSDQIDKLIAAKGA